MSKIDRVSEYFYKIVKRPLISEKVFLLAESNKYVFEVAKESNRSDIKKAISKIFNVNVIKINILNSKPKKRTFKGKKGIKSGFKKAIVTLKNGDSINITSGAN